MSILIKGMEMPGNCTDCWFRKTARHEYLSDCQLCPFTGDTTPHLTRDKKCPLVPVPPHDRLVEYHAAVHAVYNGYKDFGLTWKNAEVMLSRLPTIIPAEEGET